MMAFSAHRICPPARPVWCGYNALKLSMDLASFVGASAVGTLLWFRRRDMNAIDPRRKRTFADFVDTLVLVILMIDVMCAVPELFYVFDKNAYPFLFYKPSAERQPDTIIFVELNTSLILLNVIWHCYIAWAVFTFIVRRHSVSRLKRNLSPRGVFLCAVTLMCIYVSAFFALWYLYDRSGDFRVIAMAAAIGDAFFIPFVVGMVVMYIRTSRALAGRSTDVAFLTGRYSRIRRKLMLITLIVPAVLAVGFISDAVSWLSISSAGWDTPVTVLYLRIIAFRSIGLMDSLIFGGAFDLCLAGPEEKEQEMFQAAIVLANSLVNCMSDSSGGCQSSAEAHSSHHHHRHYHYGHHHHHHDQKVSTSHRIKIFATTANVGGCADLSALGPIERWIPPGYDLYVIGLQECLILSELRDAIHEHLGGREAYQEFTTEIGDTTILNGMIALTVFCRTSDWESGAVMVHHGAHGKIYTGMSFGPMGRAPNKGIIGLSVRYHQVSIAAITAHFAADSHGRNRLQRRNQDACRALRDLSLQFDAEDFDCHLQHDFAILLGDLNYRVSLSPQEALDRVHQASLADHKCWEERKRNRPLSPELLPALSSSSSSLPPQPPSGCRGGGRGGDDGAGAVQGGEEAAAESSLPLPCTWREERYLESLFSTKYDEHLSAALAQEGRHCLMLGGALDDLLRHSNGAAGGGGGTSTTTPGDLMMAATTSAATTSPHRGAGGGGGRRSWGPASSSSSSSSSLMASLVRSHSSGDGSRLGTLGPSSSSAGVAGKGKHGDGDEEQGHGKHQGGDVEMVGAAEETAVGEGGGRGGGGPFHQWRATQRRPASYQVLGTTQDQALPPGRTISGSSSRSTSPVTAAGIQPPEQPWCWVRSADELTRSMAAAQILAGFRELAIKFPPSYRWVRGEHGDFLDKDRLQRCYSQSAYSSSSGHTARTPSYTDRILLHSLPDMAGAAQIMCYDMCDAVVGSDHRPVAARIDMLVDRSVHGFNMLCVPEEEGEGRDQKDGTVEGAGAGTENGDGGGQVENEAVVVPFSRASSTTSSSSSQVASSSESGAMPASSTSGSPPRMPLPKRVLSLNYAQSSISTNGTGASTGGPPKLRPYEGPLAIWKVQLSGLVFDCKGTVVDAPDVDEVVCLFPLPTEDPMARDRKSVALDESFAPKLASMRSRTGSLHKREAPPLHNVHRMAFTGGEGETLVITSTIAPRFCRHLLIKFLDAKGGDLGQGVVCLPRRPGDQSAVEGMVVPLSSGGEQQMCVRIDCLLKETPYPVPDEETPATGRSNSKIDGP